LDVATAVLGELPDVPTAPLFVAVDAWTTIGTWISLASSYIPSREQLGFAGRARWRETARRDK
jgi:hypothetical protein